MANSKYAYPPREKLWLEIETFKGNCSECNFILYPPMQTICCGMRICESCSKKLNESSKCTSCPNPDYRVISDKGHKRDLDKIKLSCAICNDQWYGSFKDLLIHLNDHHDLLCEDCDEKFVFPKQLEQHQAHRCSNRPVDCILAAFGCEKKVSCKKLSQHYLTRKHQIALNKFIKQFRGPSSLVNVALKLQKSLNEEYFRLLNECYQKIQSLFNEINPTIADCDRLKADRNRIDSEINGLRTQFTEIKNLSDKSTKVIEDLRQILTNMSLLLNEIKSKSLTGPKLISLDNTFIFKLNMVVLMDNGGTIQSEIFYTSQSGYKITLYCEQYVDEQTQKRFISISFTILPGEFDSILLWPFIYPVTIKILDLVGTKKDIVHSISSDNQISILKQPVRDGSSSFVKKQFCPVDLLIESGNTYIQDGFIFIQTGIDFTTASVHQTLNRTVPKVMNDPIHNNILSNMVVN